MTFMTLPSSAENPSCSLVFLDHSCFYFIKKPKVEVDHRVSLWVVGSTQQNDPASEFSSLIYKSSRIFGMHLWFLYNWYGIIICILSVCMIYNTHIFQERQISTAFILYICVTMRIYMWSLYTQVPMEVRRRHWVTRLELEVVGSHCIDVKNETQVLRKSSNLFLAADPSLQLQNVICVNNTPYTRLYVRLL